MWSGSFDFVRCCGVLETSNEIEVLPKGVDEEFMAMEFK